MSLNYRLVFSFSIALVRGFVVCHFCNQKSLAQNTEILRDIGAEVKETAM